MIVTDRDVTLMNAISIVFPKTIVLLVIFMLKKILESNASQTVELNLRMSKWMGKIRKSRR